MKKIEVIIKDKKTLELLEDASKGDIIDLEEINNIDKEKYKVVPIYISKDGIWYVGDELLEIKEKNKKILLE